MSFGLTLRNLHNYHFCFFGLCNDVVAYPGRYASYPVPVRQFRLLPFGLLQCLGRPKPPCHLLILLSVTSVYKGLLPCGINASLFNRVNPLEKYTRRKISFVFKNLYFRSFSRAYNECALLMQGAHTWYKAWLGLCGFDKSNLVPASVSVGHSDSRLTATTSYHHR